ncbi:hypothetical protein ACHAPU_003178 [Fusarium lateritium]
MEAILNEKKEEFSAAIQSAQNAKESAKKDYDQEKEMGMANNDFATWVLMNYPQLQATLAQYRASEAAYTQIFMQLDGSAAQAWVTERRNAHLTAMRTDDEYEPAGNKSCLILDLDNDVL